MDEIINETATPEKRKYNYQQLARLNAEKKIKRHKFFRILVIVVLILTILFSAWGVFYTLSDKNSYKIIISGSRSNALSLSFDKDFKNGYSVLQAAGAKEVSESVGATYGDIANYAEAVAKGEISIETTNNGKRGVTPTNSAGKDEYLATKVYLKNISEYTYDLLKYKFVIKVLEQSKNACSAARFMIIADTDSDSPKKIVAAQPKSDGSSEYVATAFRGSTSYIKDPYNSNENWLCHNMINIAGTTNWYYDSLECDNVTYEIAPQKSIGFAISMWYEGSDPDHCNDIMGGYITFQVTFETIE